MQIKRGIGTGVFILLVGISCFYAGGAVIPPEIVEVEKIIYVEKIVEVEKIVYVEKIVEVEKIVYVEKEPTLIDMVTNPTGFLVEGILDEEDGIFSEKAAQDQEEMIDDVDNFLEGLLG